MKLLTLSDIEIGFIYSPMVAERFQDVDLVISCGDLPHFYLEYIVSMLNIPLYYVNGNHASKVEISSEFERTSPWGAVNLHQRVVEDDTGLLLAGLEGSLLYNYGPHQYSQRHYWMKAFSLVPALLANKLRVGRYLDIFVTHAAPWGIHDQDDRPHRGIKAFNWLIKSFQPAYHFHGHIHVYRQDLTTQTQVGSTQVINTYGWRETNYRVPPARSIFQAKPAR